MRYHGLTGDDARSAIWQQAYDLRDHYRWMAEADRGDGEYDEDIARAEAGYDDLRRIAPELPAIDDPDV